jgi:hypothetical protein
MRDHPPLDDILIDAVHTITANWHTCMPGRVVSYDAASRTASVQPLIRAKDWQTGETFERPTVPRVPVMFPGGAGALIVWELAAGDEVLLMFASRDLSTWRSSSSGEQAEPAIERRFSLSDAICLAGFQRSSQPPAVEIRLTDDGRVRIGSPAVDLIAAVSDALGAIAGTAPWVVTGTSVSGGAVTGTAVVDPAMAATLQALKTLLDTLKVSG